MTNALGLGVVDVPAEVQRKLRIKGGVQVKIAEGTAAKAGLQEGDIVLALNDTDVTGAKQFGELVAKLDKGRGGPAGPSRRADAVGGGARVQIRSKTG